MKSNPAIKNTRSATQARFSPEVVDGNSTSSQPTCPDFLASECQFKPSAFYFRRDAREETDPEELRALALAVIAEHEKLMAWVASKGLTPPQWMTSVTEAEEKGLDHAS